MCRPFGPSRIVWIPSRPRPYGRGYFMTALRAYPQKVSFLLLNSQSECLYDFYIGRRVAILLVDHSKATCVIPHGPADAVLFQRGAHILNPDGAIGRRRKFAKAAEFITSERDLILCSPCGRYRNLPVDAGGVPTVFAIAK